MKNQDQQIEKSESKKDSINLASAKINLSKGKKELTNKEGILNAKKSLYNGMDQLSSDEQKNFRSKLRSKLKNHVKTILGKDRSDEERTKGIQEFLEFYKKNWKITDFKIENFSQSKNNVDIKDYSTLLEYVKSTLE